MGAHQTDKRFRLYLHIPFCERKCSYCDFLSAPAAEETREAYVQKLISEIKLRGDGRKTASLFVGGGTPSILDARQMEAVMDAVRESFAMDPDAECTIEANPGTLTPEKLSAYRGMGFNRLSIGLQSADDSELLMLGRIHDYRTFLDNFHAAREEGFENINVDLISAIPGQTAASWERTLRKTAELGPEHMSAYSLILEPGTPMGDNPPGNLPDEDEERKIYASTGRILAEYGYSQYEISNYAKDVLGLNRSLETCSGSPEIKAGLGHIPTFACLHNIGYWTGDEYMGLGLGASSYLDGKRLRNPVRPEDYPGEPDVMEIIGPQEAMEEFMILGLRMTAGVSRTDFETRFGVSMDAVYGDVITRFVKMSLMDVNGDRVFLTPAGIDVSNRVLEEFLVNGDGSR